MRIRRWRPRRSPFYCECGEDFTDLGLALEEWPAFLYHHKGTYAHHARMLNLQVRGLGDALLGALAAARDSFLRRGGWIP